MKEIDDTGVEYYHFEKPGGMTAEMYEELMKAIREQERIEHNQRVNSKLNNGGQTNKNKYSKR